MKFKSSSPEFLRFWNPIVDILKNLGGSGTTREVIDAVVEKLGISEEELSQTLKNGASRIENQISWARAYLVMDGFLDSSQRGVWSLTERGFKVNFSDDHIYDRYKEIQRKHLTKAAEVKSKQQKQIAIEDVTDDVVSDEQNHRVLLLNKLKSLKPEGFERLCQRLLREAGFQKVTVTKQTRDGGIDGEGILKINELLTFRVKFQCKRYKDSVGSEEIQQFKGALDSSRTDKGIFITTSRFTKQAKEEVEKGSIPIQLVDGEMLIDMFEQLKLGLMEKTIFEIDDNFFEEFK